MTATRTAAVSEAPVTLRPSERSATAVGWFGTVDHKRIGRLFVGLSVTYGLLALVLDALVKLDRSDAGGYLVFDDRSWLQGLHLSLDGIVLLMLLPLFCGLALYVVPLQLGVGSIAMPRLAAASFWGYATSSTILVCAYAIDGGPGGGDDQGVALYLVALAMLAISLSAAAVCIATTVLGLRHASLGFSRVPPFSWAAMVTSVTMLLTLGSLVGLLALLYVDLRYGQAVFGGSAGVPAHLQWLYVHPQIFLVAIPALGVLLEIAPVSVRGRLPSAGIWQGLIGLVGLVSFGAWANQAIVDNALVLGDSGRVLAEEALSIAYAVVAVLAVLGVLGVAATCLRSGRPRLTPAAALAAVAVAMLVGGMALAAIGSLVDATLADGTFKLRETAWRDGVFALVVYGGGIGGLTAGALWWAPKMYGRTTSGVLGWLQVLALAAGVTLVAVPSLVAGAVAELSFGPLHPGTDLAEPLALAAAAGSLVVFASVASLILNLFISVLAGRGDPAGPDPVGGHTLEWTTTSPPPPGNFAVSPFAAGVAEPAEPASDDDTSTGAAEGAAVSERSEAEVPA